MSGLLQGQTVSSEQFFPVEGYSVFEIGYPIKVVPAERGRFTYLEFWAEGKQGRRITNYYLENYGVKDYVEYWFKPVTDEGYEPLRVSDLVRLESAYMVLGTQYLSEEKSEHRVGRVFSLDGKPLGP
ncbi:MAG: hypothetical protein AAF206_26810, partial [Bacteroidota bacterium]